MSTIQNVGATLKTLGLADNEYLKVHGIAAFFVGLDFAVQYPDEARALQTRLVSEQFMEYDFQDLMALLI